MNLPPITYLTTDSLNEGVGASQVLAYVEGLARRGLEVRLHSFEKTRPTDAQRRRLSAEGVHWTPHDFGATGARGGLTRVGVGALAVRGAELLHARSDLAAASGLLVRSPCWVWDVRSLWADQRIALGALSEGGPEHRVLQRVERAAARRSTAVITLAEAVLPVLTDRHGPAVQTKATVIPTCVDLQRFRMSSMPSGPAVNLLLAGTLNTYYDVDAMLRLASVGRRRRRAALHVLSPTSTPWDVAFAQAAAQRDTATPDEMPDRLAASHVGLSVCRADAGVSLTAAMPTKVAEFLAVGRPVVVNPGLGDADHLVEEARAGVVLRDLSPRGLELAWDRVEELVADPETPHRCRALATERFDLERGLDRLIEIYARAAQSR